ncbi:MAG: hypothetical protein Q4C34_02910 [Bacteroidales bacterium]|nr:hypothetical protein [Bacteroidales bacterium]
MAPSSETLTRRLVTGLWINWMMAFGSIALVLAFPFFMAKSWMPLPVLAVSYMLLVYSRRESQDDTPGCVLTLRVAMLTLFWSAVAMMVINFLNSSMMFDGAIDWSTSNHDIPYITGLVVFPVMMCICLWMKIRGYNTRFCRNCMARNGFFPGNGVVSSLYSRESRYQVSLLLCLSVALSAVEWWYYFYYYINVNMNTPDRFFFNYMPISIYLLSLYFMWMRYTNLAAIIGPISSNNNERDSEVRYLILAGDQIKLVPGDSNRWDTPARSEVNPAQFITDEDARKEFTRLSGCTEFVLKFLYASKAHDMHGDVLHYATFIPEEHRDNGWLPGQWFTLDQVDRLMKTARLSAELSDEIYRIFTITMAWKTYDRNGRRLYPIKHYRPTFRFRDFKDWDVDYGDTSWLDVADNNEDRPFFRTRRLWRRFTGILDR